MKILALRGENLASLAGRFSLDFTADPLAGAGLFAITGDTGAGKSTLLDALCLALYGEYPRLDFSSNETSLDPSGEAIKASDPRHVLRRGAGLGYAEVDFEDREGLTYRARWEVSRAKEKASGSLKNVKRSLVRLSDGETLASNSKDVSRQVQGLTGLNFEQFRRTSLLAQGHFDAFLTATGNDRAALLERITGAEIYARISQSVYRGSEQRREAFHLLKAQLQQILCLTDEARGLLEISLAELQRQAESASSEIATLDASLGFWKSHANALSAREAASVECAKAESALSARSADRQHLLDLNLVEPIRPLFASAKQAKSVEDQATIDLTSASQDLEHKLQRFILAQTTQLNSQTGKDEIDAVVNTMAPRWQEAERLDFQLQEARQQVQAAATSLAEKLDQHGEKSKAHAHFSSQHQQYSAQLAEARSWLDEHSDQANPVAQLPTAEQLFAARFQIQKQQEDLSSSLPTLANDLKNLGTQLVGNQSGLDMNQDVVSALDGEIAQLVIQIASLPQAELLARRASLTDTLGRYNHALQLCRSSAAAKATLAVDRDAADLVETQLQGYEHTQTALLSQIAQKQGALTEATRASEQAEQTISESAQSLRARLSPDNPCPVCGSTDHPFLRDDPHMAAFAAQYRVRREELDAVLSGLNQQHTQLLGQRATGSASRERHVLQAQASQVQINSFQKEYTDLLCFLPPALPADLSPVALSVLTDLLSTTTQEQSSVHTALEALQLKKERHTGLLEQRNTLQQQLLTSNASRAALLDRQNQITIQITQNRALHQSCETQHTGNSRQLAPLLAPFSITLEQLDLRFPRMVEQFRAGCLEYSLKNTRSQQLILELNTAANDLNSAKSALDTSCLGRDEATLSHDQKQRRLEEVQAMRSLVLDGQLVAQHKQAHADLQSAAHQSHLMASTELAAAQSAHEAANQLKLNYETRLNQVHSVRLAAKAKYIEACQGILLEPTQVRDLIESDPQTRQQLQTALTTLDQQRHTATQLLHTAEASLASTLAACNSLAPVIALAAAHDAADLARTGALQRIGIDQQKLTQDNQQRNQHAALRIQVDSARETHDIWRDVNSVIGSAAGDKFRKFVQSLTLDHLVHLANHHLATFSQRYSLVRTGNQDLGLQIRDREMADAIRPVATLSGGERFLISLGLALALSSLEGNDSFVDCLFIDEGFGSLDAESLDLVMLALETLPGSGRRVGIITHVAAMMDRIAVQVRVNKQGNGRSSIKIVDASLDNWALFASTLNTSSLA